MDIEPADSVGKKGGAESLVIAGAAAARVKVRAFLFTGRLKEVKRRGAGWISGAAANAHKGRVEKEPADSVGERRCVCDGFAWVAVVLV